MGIFHIVMFEFTPDASTERVQEVCQGMLKLKEQCIRPHRKTPYIMSIVGGRDISPEGLQEGITHGFIMEFENDEDRMYYLEKEPANIDFDKTIVDVVKRAQVIDFAPDRF